MDHHHHHQCSCDPYHHCEHRPHGWRAPSPPRHHHGPPQSYYGPPPPGPGRVIPAWGLPPCNHNYHNQGCNHCGNWRWQ